MSRTVLVVDDKPNLLKSLELGFRNHGYKALTAFTAVEALGLFSRERVDAAIVDLRLGADNGLELLQRMHLMRPDVPVIVLTGYATVKTAVEALKLGAFDYIEKPAGTEKLLRVMENGIRLRGLEKDNAAMRAKLEEESYRTVTQDLDTLELLAKARALAEGEIPILITGESGTGKELLADLIHLSSSRASKAIVKVNCAALPDTLIDNELFGHEKGAFTGATTSYKGVFERADGSTLFLDEIADMPLHAQARILRALQSGEINRLGGNRTIRVNVRFVAATNRDMTALAGDGQFRQDLLYRISAALLHIKPLRERPGDIPVLCDHFLEDYARRMDLPKRAVAPEVMQALLFHRWPGNIRELRNSIEYAATLARDGTIRAEHLPSAVFGGKSVPEVAERRGDGEARIRWALRETGNNKKRAAELLGISRKTLYNWIERYGLVSEHD
ncbi:MAG: sigma-54-dependent transcriptional regulator [Spirochaetaceae bacterium]